MSKNKQEYLSLDKAEWWCDECGFYTDISIEGGDILCGVSQHIIATFKVTDPRQLAIPL